MKVFKIHQKFHVFSKNIETDKIYYVNRIKIQITKFSCALIEVRDFRCIRCDMYLAYLKFRMIEITHYREGKKMYIDFVFIIFLHLFVIL